MEEIEPRNFDVERLYPAPDAEPIISITFLLELPYCLRVPELSFLISDWGNGWDGWSGDAVGHFAEMAPLPEGVEPRFRIAFGQSEVDGRVPLEAAELAFPDWKGASVFSGGDAPSCSETRTSALVTVYSRMLETPFVDEDQDEVIEWVSRRLDESLSVLSQYLVILAAMHDEWHISSISRIDLPRVTPWKLDVRPTPEGWTGSKGTLDAHTSLRDDLPEERAPEELMAAAEIIHRYRQGEFPFFDWLELYQAAEHHLGSGRYGQSVIAGTTATEVLINTLFRVLAAAGELDPKRLDGVLQTAFKNQLTVHLPKFLEEDLCLDSPDHPAGRWQVDCYQLRHRVVHEGRKPTSAEAWNAKVATGEFSRWIGRTLIDRPSLQSVKAFLQGDPNEGGEV